MLSSAHLLDALDNLATQASGYIQQDSDCQSFNLNCGEIVHNECQSIISEMHSTDELDHLLPVYRQHVVASASSSRSLLDDLSHRFRNRRFAYVFVSIFFMTLMLFGACKINICSGWYV